MKIHILNDLHLKHAPMAPVAVRGDVLVLAGDISDGGDPDAVKQLCSLYVKSDRPVIYVAGNHEFYGRFVEDVLWSFSREFKGSGIQFLHDKGVKLDNVSFFGTTLWTDYDLLGADNRAASMSVARQFMADHSWIKLKDFRFPKGARNFDPLDARKMHLRAVRKLVRWSSSQADTPLVVISHHAPTAKSIHRQYAGHPANGSFVSELSPLIRSISPKLWIHGHVHNSMDYFVGATRVLANPRGYPLGRKYGQKDLIFENTEFLPGYTVKI